MFIVYVSRLDGELRAYRSLKCEG